MQRLFLLLILLISYSCSSAQHIKRKGAIGVSFYQRPTDSLKQVLKYTKGVIVQGIVPATTAEQIGLKPNDIILQINQEPINDVSSLLQKAKQLRDSDPIIVRVLRSAKELTLHGNVVPKPMEISERADIVYGEFAYGNGYVRTIYKTLKNKKPLGTVFFLQGLPCYSMDNFKELDKTKQAIDAMVDRGFAVYRIEKADMGDNVNMAPCETMGFNEELKMYQAGYAHLLQMPDVDTSNVFLFGHSMGGITAPLLTSIHQPKGIAVYGTVFKPWLEYLFDAYLLQQQYYGFDLAMLRAELETMKRPIFDYFYNDRSFSEVYATAAGKKAMQTIIEYNDQNKLAAGRSPLCHKELNQQPLTAAWRNTTAKVLAVYGECDIAAIHPDDHQALVAYINKWRPGNASFLLEPGTTHNFEAIGTMQQFLAMQSDPVSFEKYAVTRFNEKLFDRICDWMRSVI
jgi:pimeloyl-ACP methyl ester carboxylesterase